MADAPLPADIESDIARLEDEDRRFRRGAIDPAEFRRTRRRFGIIAEHEATDRYLLRIPAPLGLLTPGQLEAAADVAWAGAVRRPIVVNPRQGLEIHGVEGQDLGDALRRLAAAGFPVPSGGDRVRCVAASPWAGIDPAEPFNVAAHAWAAYHRFRGHPDFQALPRQVRIAFASGADDLVHATATDIGLLAATASRDGAEQPGFQVLVGGALGPAPRAGDLLEPFTPETAALATIEAVLRVYDRRGNRSDRSRARLRWLLEDLGPDAFRREVLAERDRLVAYGSPWEPEAPPGPDESSPPMAGLYAVPPRATDAYARWCEAFVRPQKQAGFSSVRVRGVTGRFTAAEARAVADLARRACGGRMRLTPLQDILFRWVPDPLLPALFARLEATGLLHDVDGPGRNLICCAGAPACPWSVTNAAALAEVIRTRMTSGPAMAALRIGIAGCSGGCGHPRLADIGLAGEARTVAGRAAPVYLIFIGAVPRPGGMRFGQPLLEIPARRAPEAIRRLLILFREAGDAKEVWPDFVERMGADPLRWVLSDLARPGGNGSPPEDLFKDWGSDDDYRPPLRRGEDAL
jgi:sulfite reductase beta subunit-like hemoprotein